MINLFTGVTLFNTGASRLRLINDTEYNFQSNPK